MRSVRIFDTVEDLPPDALSLLESGGLFSDPIWWRVVEGHAMPAGAKAGYIVVFTNDGVAGVMPVLRSGRHVDALTTAYTCAYAPVFADDVTRTAAALSAACRGDGICRIDALAAEWQDLAGFTDGIRRAGLLPLRFDHFGNWSENVGGQDWAQYLAKRQGALRETIRRRLRRAEGMAEARFDLFQEPGSMDEAAAAFESVYARSWKDPEPYPTFNVALMKALAPAGMVRIGVWSIGGTPVAAQFWVVRDGTAIVLKLAHDEAYKAYSPGTVLTALTVRHMLQEEWVQRIDFGRGDDAYKRGWASERRQRIGLLLANPLTVTGMRVLLRHGAGRLRTNIGGAARKMLSREATSTTV